MRDDIDYVPIEPKFLLSQHFSAIAAAGPIVGPILAGVMFGWLPALIWILVGAIFIGGVHDMAALVASIRHKARSIAEVVRDHMSQRSYVLFLMFIWIALVYIIVAFTDITASSFVGVQTLENGETGLRRRHRHVVAAVFGAADCDGTVAALHATVGRLGHAHFFAAGGCRDLGRPKNAARSGRAVANHRRPGAQSLGCAAAWDTASWQQLCRCGCCFSRAGTWAATFCTWRWRPDASACSSAVTRCSIPHSPVGHLRRRLEHQRVLLHSCSSRLPAVRAQDFIR